MAPVSSKQWSLSASAEADHLVLEEHGHRAALHPASPVADRLVEEAIGEGLERLLDRLSPGQHQVPSAGQGEGLAGRQVGERDVGGETQRRVEPRRSGGDGIPGAPAGARGSTPAADRESPGREAARAGARERGRAAWAGRSARAARSGARSRGGGMHRRRRRRPSRARWCCGRTAAFPERPRPGRPGSARHQARRAASRRSARSRSGEGSTRPRCRPGAPGPRTGNCR